MAEDPGAAFRLYSAAARAGSVWATEMIAWQYWTGTGVGVELDLADEQYRRAIALGSQMAMIGYARLLDERGEYIASDRVLEDGLASDFIPASYWLARLRYERIKTKRTAMEVRPMLEKAAAHGHPGAGAELARMKAIGKLGLRNVPDGFRLIFRLAFNSAKEAG